VQCEGDEDGEDGEEVMEEEALPVEAREAALTAGDDGHVEEVAGNLVVHRLPHQRHRGGEEGEEGVVRHEEVMGGEEETGEVVAALRMGDGEVPRREVRGEGEVGGEVDEEVVEEEEESGPGECVEDDIWEELSEGRVRSEDISGGGRHRLHLNTAEADDVVISPTCQSAAQTLLEPDCIRYSERAACEAV
jgi:hypothetical protein